MKKSDETLSVCEIFRSIAGETTHAGRPAVFVRLAGCNLACRFCDTGYARSGGQVLGLSKVLAWVRRAGEPLVVVTGGEPLLQPGTGRLLRALRRDGREVLLETNGSLDLGVVPRGVRVILDVKCPGSGESRRNRRANLARLRPGDELKFVISDRRDFAWALRLLSRTRLPRGVAILFSPVQPDLPPGRLAEWMLGARLPPHSRLQIQLHRALWPAGGDGDILWRAHAPGRTGK
ncbi:MAG: radical SAM protein [Myxococcales bacterium]|nr:radical SAM protein [Myxococcales bacterium]